MFYFFGYLLHKGPEDSKCVSEQRQHHQSWGFWNFQDDDNSSPSPNCARHTILYQPRDGKRMQLSRNCNETSILQESIKLKKACN
jgi:hypothetical protein